MLKKCSDQSIFSDPEEKTKIHLALERDGEIIANSLDAKGIEDLSSYYLETNEWKTEAILYEKHPLIKEACRGDNLRVIKTTSGNDKGKSIYNFFCHNMAIYIYSNFLIFLEKILKDSLDLISSPSPSVKI